MITLGMTVMPKKIGLPSIGRVVELMDADFFMAQGRVISIEQWTELYPDWRSKPVAIILYNNPQRVHTYEKFKEMVAEPKVPEAQLKIAYNLHVPFQSTNSYPIDDLEAQE